MAPNKSRIQTMSGIKLRVAMMSSQKKKLYLNSRLTRELMKISTENKMSDTINKE